MGDSFNWGLSGRASYPTQPEIGQVNPFIVDYMAANPDWAGIGGVGSRLPSPLIGMGAPGMPRMPQVGMRPGRDMYGTQEERPRLGGIGERVTTFKSSCSNRTVWASTTSTLTSFWPVQ